MGKMDDCGGNWEVWESGGVKREITPLGTLVSNETG